MPICDYPHCCAPQYVKPLCSEHYWDFRDGTFPGDVLRWLATARDKAGLAPRDGEAV